MSSLFFTWFLRDEFAPDSFPSKLGDGRHTGKKEPSVSPQDSHQSGYYARTVVCLAGRISAGPLNVAFKLWKHLDPFEPFPTVQPTTWSWLTQRNHIFFGVWWSWCSFAHTFPNKPPEIRWFLLSPSPGIFSACLLTNHPTRHATGHDCLTVYSNAFKSAYLSSTFRWFWGRFKSATYKWN